MLALRRAERTSLRGCEYRTIPYTNLAPGHHPDCANFCAHPTDRGAHLRTASQMLRLRLSRFVSAGTLKTGRLLSVVRLPLAQEASGSNPDAPTKNISLVFFYFLKAPFTSNPICGIPAGRRSRFTSRLIPKSSPHDKFSETRRGRSAIQKLLN